MCESEQPAKARAAEISVSSCRARISLSTCLSRRDETRLMLLLLQRNVPGTGTGTQIHIHSPSIGCTMAASCCSREGASYEREQQQRRRRPQQQARAVVESHPGMQAGLQQEQQERAPCNELRGRVWRFLRRQATLSPATAYECCCRHRHCSSLSLSRSLARRRAQWVTSRADHGRSTHLMSRSADDGGEDGSRSVITGEASFAHSRAIVDHESRHVVVAHFDSEKDAWTRDDTRTRGQKRVSAGTRSQTRTWTADVVFAGTSRRGSRVGRGQGSHL